MTLSQALLPQSLVTKALMVTLGAAFIAGASQVAIGQPVPMTLQTLAILIVGFTYGARMAALTLVAYLLAGLAGAPVFAKGMNGLAFAGPTAGFLVGFVGMAWLAGFAADRGVKGLVPVALTGIAISALLYIPGAAWAMLADRALGFDTAAWGADDFSMIWAYYVAPFILGDAVKAVIAALVVAGGWAAVRAKS
jgi:biotin transport system substrate-specific component